MIWDMSVDRGATTLAMFTRSRGAWALPLPTVSASQVTLFSDNFETAKAWTTYRGHRDVRMDEGRNLRKCAFPEPFLDVTPIRRQLRDQPDEPADQRPGRFEHDQALVLAEARHGERHERRCRLSV